MEVICLENKAFFALVQEVIKTVKEQNNIKEDRWIPPEQAMKMLRITSRTTLLKLRNEGAIRFSQPQKKIILFDRESILDYLNKHANETF